MRATHLPAGASGAGRRSGVLSWLANKREAERLREARENAGLTRQQLADRLGVKKPWLQYRETFRTPLTAEEAERIRKAIEAAPSTAAGRTEG
jgi:transcriptional regulator with XRE-family HTH domain